MTVFMVHIELIKACMSDYTHLKEVMLSHGYEQEISDGTEGSYCLPDTMFFIESNSSAIEILTEVSQLIKKTDKEPFILVTETVSRAWKLAKQS